MNWRVRLLTSYRVIVQLIANTTTTKGLKVQAELDQGHYPVGVKITKQELAGVPLYAARVPGGLELHRPPPTAQVIFARAHSVHGRAMILIKLIGTVADRIRAVRLIQLNR